MNVCMGRQALLERQTDKTWKDIQIPCPFQWNMQHVVCLRTKFGCESRREVPVYSLHTNVNDIKLVGKSQYAYR